MPSSRFDFSKVCDLNLTFNDISSIFCYFSSLKKQGGLALRPLSFRVILKMSQNVSIKRKSKITPNWPVYLKFPRRIPRKIKNLNVGWEMSHLVFCLRLPTILTFSTCSWIGDFVLTGTAFHLRVIYKLKNENFQFLENTSICYYSLQTVKFYLKLTNFSRFY